RPVDPFDALAQDLQVLLEQRPSRLFQTVESLLVHKAYAHCRDNQVQAAKLLGVTRNTLRTLLKRHGLLSDTASSEREAVSLSSVRDSVAPSGANVATH
ncbi:MAG: helix-turn-helix domain-containing protein, partial [Rhizobacter sp.]